MRRTPLKRKSPLGRGKGLRKAAKPKLPKRKSDARLKKELDTLFSQYVRQKHANENGEVQCYTCGSRGTVKTIQNGHFVSRVYLATRFDEDNCRPQCVGCNVFGKGRVADFAAKLEAELGEGTVARLYRKAKEITKYFPYEAKIAEYREKLAALQANNKQP